LRKKILANGSMMQAKPKEHLMSVHPENAPEDLFSLVRRKLGLKKRGQFQNLHLPFHKNLSLKHPIKLVTELLNKRSPTLLERL
jgi:hypothetical protein